MKKRFISMLLVLCMVFTMFPSAAFAEDAGIAPSMAIGTSGMEEGTPLCENHKAHTADCGYAEAVEGAVCTHECELCIADKDIIADACVCEVLCTENLMNPDCKVCAAQGADLTNCVGKAAEKPPVCICEIKCTTTPECVCPPVDSGELVHGEDCPLSDPETAAAQINPDCKVCAAEGADLTQCVGKAAMLMAMPRSVTSVSTLDALNSAISSATGDMSFRLTKSMTGRVAINNSTHNFTIDLNGWILYGDDNGTAIHHSGSGTLTIKDDSAGKSGKITGAESSSTIQGYNNSTFEIIGGTIENTSTGYAIYNNPDTSKTVISSGSPVIKSIGGAAMNQAPDVSGYVGVRVTASQNYNGTSPDTNYDDTKIGTYKYLMFGVSAVKNTTTNAEYYTLQAAIDAVGEGNTLQLQKDLTDKGTIAAGKPSFTLDLNGKKLDGGAGSVVTHYGTGKLTIKDSGSNGTITSSTASVGTVYFFNEDAIDTVLEVIGGAITNTYAGNSSYGIRIGSNAKVSISGGTITGGSAAVNAQISDQHATLKITGGVLDGGSYGILCYVNNDSVSISIPSGSPVIKGGDQAMGLAPDLTGYTDGAVIASKNYDGTTPEATYDASKIADYKHLTFKTGKAPAKVTVTVPTDLVYSGTAKTPTVTITDSTDQPLTESGSTTTYSYEGTDGTTYAASSTAPTAVGKYKVTVTYEGPAYKGSATANFEITKKPVTVSISCAGKEWDDNTTATVIYSVSGVVSGDTVTAGGTSATYDSADVGTGKTVTATGITLGGADAGNYSCNDTATAANIAITKKPLTGSMISIADGTYTGSEIKPEPVVTDGVPSKITASDYTIGYQNNINGGTATVVITATEGGNYSGTATKDFTIKKGSYAGAKITKELSVRAMKAADVKFDLSQIALPNGFVNGVYSNPQSVNNDDGLVTTTTFDITNNIFSFSTTSKPNGDTAIINVTLSSDNYEDVTVEITVTAREKTSLNISIPDYDKTYDGEAPTFDASQVVLTDPSGNIVTGVELERIYFKDEYEDDYVIGAPPKDAGNYRIRIKIPDNHDVYEGSAFKGFKIAKIDPAITVATPSTGMAGKDVTVTVKITNPAGATAGFPAVSEITLEPNGNATLKTALAAVSGKPGEYAATYTIKADAAKDTTITFTATVPTATTNYNADSTGVTKSLTVSNNRGTQTTLIADKASVTYGESTTLTATVQKATAGDPGTPAGTVQFKVGGNNIGTAQTLTNGKATLTVDKAALQAASGGKTYSFTAAFTATGDYADSTSSPATVTVAQKPLTIRAKNQFTYQNKTTLPTPVLEYDGLVDGETITGYTAAHSVSDTKTFGTFAINVTGSTANTNYAVTTQNGRLTIYEDTNKKDPPVTELPSTPADKPIVVAEPSDPAKQLRVITAVLAEEEAEPAANWLLTQPEVKPDDLMESHEVELQVSTDGGTTWRKATMADVKAGKVKVALPLPAGTDPTTHSYIIYHFANGTDSPANESFIAPDYNAASKTLSATVTSLSPFVVVATPKGGGINNSTDDDSSSRNDDEYEFWMTVKENIQKADDSDVVKVNARGYDRMPWSVIDALRKKSGVSMVITWSGKTITIPAGKAQKNEPGRIYWPLSKLAELYAGIDDATVLAPVNPETGGPGKYIPVTGGSTLVVEAPEIQHDSAIPTTIREQAITPPDAGFEANAYAGTPDAKKAGSMNAAALAGFVVLLAALCGGIWFQSRKARAKEQ